MKNFKFSNTPNCFRLENFKFPENNFSEKIYELSKAINKIIDKEVVTFLQKFDGEITSDSIDKVRILQNQGYDFVIEIQNEFSIHDTKYTLKAYQGNILVDKHIFMIKSFIKNENLYSIDKDKIKLKNKNFKVWLEKYFVGC